MKYLLVDTETIGLMPPDKGSGVVQVAWLELDEQGNELKAYNHLVNPEAEIHPKASEVHGLYYEDVKDAPLLPEVFSPTGACTHIGHNAVFDLRFVGHQYENLAGRICTLELARIVWPKAPNHKLTTLIEYLGLPGFQAHDALADVRATAEVLRQISADMGKTLPELAAYCSKAKVVYTMPFGMHKGTPIAKLPIKYIKYFNDKEIDSNLRLAFDQQLKLRG